MASDVVTGMELVKENAIANFRDVLGPTDPQEAKANARGSLRAHFGADGMRNGIHGSGSGAEFQRETEFFFSKAFGPTAAFNNCTCAIIKPHIIKEGLAG